ncbi:MAG TPA: hypothetical protein VFW73_12585, partial [Lacipirellulaceae bacterium]|nr:hypothetical protein [Lacipirellulaceae bacterium]
GVPHMLEIDYPADTEQSFGISIVEPNAYGVINGINRDMQVYVEGLGRSEAKHPRTQRLVFWPRTQAPMLVITNLHPTAAAHFGQIRVFKRSTTRLTDDQPAHTAPRNRLIAAYIARRTAEQTFGATQVIDPISAANGVFTNCVDDAQTAYETATRMADYLRYAGYNSAVVNLPLRKPIDSQSNSSNLLDVDATELMLRVFDREGISLMPAIDFAAPLPQLEAMRRKSDPQTSGLEWVGPDGRTWVDAHGSPDGRAPYYNLLDGRVQQAMLERIRELIDHYGGHRSLAGLAVRLSSDGYAQLPPLEWGLDDATFARFASDRRIPSTAMGTDRFAARHALVTGPYAEAWRSWRAAQVSAFYSQLAGLVRGTTDRRLLLTTENMFDDPQLAMRLRPNLIAEHIENGVASTMLDAGIDRQALGHVAGVSLCPTRYVESMAALPDRAVDLNLNEAFALWRQSTSPAQPSAAVIYHRPLSLRLESFEAARTPWRVLGSMQLDCEPLPQGPAVRESYLDALANNDPSILLDGGDLLPLGQDDELRATRSIVAQLPTSGKVADISKQPVIVRSYSEANRVTIVVMNMSPWHCDAQVALDVSQATALESLAPLSPRDPSAAKPIPLSAGRQSWPITLAPYEIRAARIPISDAKVVGVQAEVPDSANAELAAKLSDMTNRDLTAPRVYTALPNPSFEPLPHKGPLPNWRLSDSTGLATAQLDATHPQDGETSLNFRRELSPLTALGSNQKRPDESPVVVESDSFPTPPTGQLAMTVFARGHNLGPNTELRLVFESSEGHNYRRAASISAAKLQQPNDQWGFFAIYVNDLPLTSRGQMRIAFELTGPGEVWLDNVKLYDLLFPLAFYCDAQAEILQLSKQLHAAKSAFDAHQTTDCLQILDGYWPRFILAYRPPLQPPMIATRPAKTESSSPPQSDERQQPAPGIGDRLKRLVPILR